jgi:hypothetical protein
MEYITDYSRAERENANWTPDDAVYMGPAPFEKVFYLVFLHDQKKRDTCLQDADQSLLGLVPISGPNAELYDYTDLGDENSERKRFFPALDTLDFTRLAPMLVDSIYTRYNMIVGRPPVDDAPLNQEYPNKNKLRVWLADTSIRVKLAIETFLTQPITRHFCVSSLPNLRVQHDIFSVQNRYACEKRTREPGHYSSSEILGAITSSFGTTTMLADGTPEIWYSDMRYPGPCCLHKTCSSGKTTAGEESSSSLARSHFNPTKYFVEPLFCCMDIPYTLRSPFETRDGGRDAQAIRIPWLQAPVFYSSDVYSRMSILSDLARYIDFFNTHLERYEKSADIREALVYACAVSVFSTTFDPSRRIEHAFRSLVESINDYTTDEIVLASFYVGCSIQFAFICKDLIPQFRILLSRANPVDDKLGNIQSSSKRSDAENTYSTTPVFKNIFSTPLTLLRTFELTNHQRASVEEYVENRNHVMRRRKVLYGGLYCINMGETKILKSTNLGRDSLMVDFMSGLMYTYFNTYQDDDLGTTSITSKGYPEFSSANQTLADNLVFQYKNSERCFLEGRRVPDIISLSRMRYHQLLLNNFENLYYISYNMSLFNRRLLTRKRWRDVPPTLAPFDKKDNLISCSAIDYFKRRVLDRLDGWIEGGSSPENTPFVDKYTPVSNLETPCTAITFDTFFDTMACQYGEDTLVKCARQLDNLIYQVVRNGEGAGDKHASINAKKPSGVRPTDPRILLENAPFPLDPMEEVVELRPLGDTTVESPEDNHGEKNESGVTLEEFENFLESLQSKNKTVVASAGVRQLVNMTAVFFMQLQKDASVKQSRAEDARKSKSSGIIVDL